MPYVFLGCAITVEIIATSLLGSTHGFTRPLPTAIVLLLYATSFVFLSRTIKDVPVGVAYALWSGIGTVAIVAIGAVFLGNPVNAATAAGVALVVAGVVVLNLGGAVH